MKPDGNDCCDACGTVGVAAVLPVRRIWAAERGEGRIRVCSDCLARIRRDRYDNPYLTHRCFGSLNHHASIRFCIGVHPDPCWMVGVLEEDPDWGTTFMNTVLTGIRYCPYCGRQPGEKRVENKEVG